MTKKTPKTAKTSANPPPVKQTGEEAPRARPGKGYAIMSAMLGLLVITFASYLFSRHNATPLMTDHTHDVNGPHEAPPAFPEVTPPPFEGEAIETPQSHNNIVLEEGPDHKAIEQIKQIEADISTLETQAVARPSDQPAHHHVDETAAHQTQQLEPRAWQQPYYPGNRQRLKTLMMEQLAVDTLFYNAERGRPFKMDIEIAEKFIQDPTMRAKINGLMPYALSGLPHMEDIEKEAKTVLAKSQLLTPDEDDRIAGKFIKSILRISKKEPLAPALKAALAGRNLPRALELTQKLIEHGYPLQGIERDLTNLQNARAQVQGAKMAYHDYFLILFNQYNPEQS